MNSGVLNDARLASISDNSLPPMPQWLGGVHIKYVSTYKDEVVLPHVHFVHQYVSGDGTVKTLPMQC